jgi:hypothetical protein
LPRILDPFRLDGANKSAMRAFLPNSPMIWALMLASISAKRKRVTRQPVATAQIEVATYFFMQDLLPVRKDRS